MGKFLILGFLLWISLLGCSPFSLADTEKRLFLDINLEFLGEYILPKQTLADHPVGGLSGLTYDRLGDRFYAISDDRKDPRFYTLKLSLEDSPQGLTHLKQVTVEDVTFLKEQTGKRYADNTIDGEGIALTPRETLFISSEGDIKKNVLPFIGEFDLKTGELQQYLRLPNRFLPSNDNANQGIQNNLGFEALAISATSTLKDDPFRLFTATENALIQDRKPNKNSSLTPLRFLHYLINSIGEPGLVGENLYLLASPPSGTLAQGLSDITTLEKEGYFISLERDLGLAGFGAKLFQVVNANATDTSNILSFKEGVTGLEPLRKQLLLDLDTLNIDLDNLEGLALGPHLADGSQTLLLVSDDNFRKDQVTQFLLFRVKIS